MKVVNKTQMRDEFVAFEVGIEIMIFYQLKILVTYFQLCDPCVPYVIILLQLDFK